MKMFILLFALTFCSFTFAQNTDDGSIYCKFAEQEEEITPFQNSYLLECYDSDLDEAGIYLGRHDVEVDEAGAFLMYLSEITEYSKIDRAFLVYDKSQLLRQK